MNKDEYVKSVCSSKVNLNQYKPFLKESRIEVLLRVAERLQNNT